MSLVLEALRKQEAGSNPEAAVSLALAGRARRRHRLWAALFAAAMAANAALVVWVFVLPAASGPGPGLTPSSNPNPSPSSASTSASASTPVGATSRSRSGAPGNRDQEVAPTGSSGDRGVETALTGGAGGRDREVAPTGGSATGGSSTGGAGAPRRVRLGELPADVRGRFPGIAFSTHIYADDADLRAVVANGERITEGERVRGLTVVEITEGGVVLAFERYEVEVPIVTDWDSL